MFFNFELDRANQQNEQIDGPVISNINRFSTSSKYILKIFRFIDVKIQFLLLKYHINKNDY